MIFRRFLENPLWLVRLTLTIWFSLPMNAIGMQIVEVRETTDGMTDRFYRVTANGSSFRFQASGEWLLMRQSAGSIALEHRLQPKLTIHWLALDDSSSVRGFPEDWLDDYLSWIGRSFPQYDWKQTNSGKERPPVGSSAFLGGPFRTVELLLTLKEDPDPEKPLPQTLQLRDIVGGLGSQTIILRFMAADFSGDLGVFDSLRPSTADWIATTHGIQPNN